MRFWAVLVFLFCSSAASLAQFSNNWVQYNQTYYKISVTQTGLYRLTYNQLQQAGVPVNSIDPRLLQVFHRGVEQAIYFKHDQAPADSKFDTGEYLEFYGQRNDGEMDSKLYQPSTAQPHKYYNLFSDSSAYFLTVNPLPVQGKRMEVFDQVNSTGIPKETAHLEQRLSVYTAEYSTGDIIQGYIQQSHFDEGEGWTGQTICTQNTDCVGNEQRDFPIDQLTSGLTSQPPPTMEIQMAGRDQLQHQAEIYVGPTTGSLRLLTSRLFDNFQTPVINAGLNWSDFGPDGKMVVRVRAVGVGGFRERLSVSYIKVLFHQAFQMGSLSAKTFFLKPNVAAKSYIEVEGTPSGARMFDVSDPSNVIQIGTRISGTAMTAVIANTNEARTIYVTNAVIAPPTSSIRPVTFRNINTNADYLIVTHRSLMQPGLSYSNPVQAYAAYRASEEGGSYDTLTITIDQLYNQFNYGEPSPVAIYEFMRYMIARGNPKYLFLLGKGRDVTAGLYRRALLPNELPDLVPPAGNPGSDMTFTAGMKGEPYVPAVATGRLTATTPAQVAAYLNKVKEAEAAPFDELWRKKILHLSGGIRANELVLFRSYMEGFAERAKGNFLGGDVITLGKHGVSNIEFINISKEINAGLNMVTFFGHSASNATDIDIGYVSQPVFGYNNTGKYPAFLVNGCNAGEFFNNGVNFGEDWMLAAGKGARAFIANSSFGFDTGLRLYTNYFYDVAYADSIFLSKGIGDVQKEVARRFLADFGNGKSTYTAQVQQMVLLGDPSIRLFAPTSPDYDMSDASVQLASFDGKPVHALTDSVEIQVIVRNLGRATKRPLTVKFIHTVNDVATIYSANYDGVLSQDTLTFTIRRGTGTFFGNNRIEVFLDPQNKIEELRENNNQGTFTRFIQFNGTQNLQPPDFGIVSSTSLEALFQDTDVLAGERSYLSQLDTVPTFNSTWLQSKTIAGKVLVRSLFQLTGKDSAVYYWRTRPADKPDDQWEQTSFTYIKNGSPGWAQMAYDQLAENSFNNIVPTDGKQFGFKPTHVSIFIKTFGSANATPGITGSFQVDNAEYYFSPQGFNCRNNTINLVAFDRSSVVPYQAVPFTFENSGGRACGREPQLINSFTAAETDTGNNDDLIRYVDNLKAGDSVVLFSMGDPGFSSWSAAVKGKLGEIGIRASDIDAFVPGEPIIILGRKGALAGTAKIIRSDQPQPETQELQLNEDLTGYANSGSMTSVVIGPAVKWKSMAPSFTLQDASDVAGVDIYGVRRDGKEELLFFDQRSDIPIDNIDASVFPYLRLLHRTRDEISLTPVLPRNWLVLFDPAPDGLLLFDGQPEPITVQEGVAVEARFKFVNYTSTSFSDSLSASVNFVNRQTLQKAVTNFKIKGPAASDTTRFKVSLPTRGRVGVNDVAATVNSGMITEQYYQNNGVELASWLNVYKDRSNPVLDVTIDDRYVMNGDYVSANPVIRVLLRDENNILPLSDTTALNVLLTSPCASASCSPKRIHFSSGDVKWSVNGNVLVMEYRPLNMENGTYTLLAEGRDVSGNPTGSDPYEVIFQIDREAGVRFLQPYPNPSSVGFFFEFVASGEAAPESYVLSIINRNGQEVATFTDSDGRQPRVGINQLQWSGLDEQGRRLSDGLYVYQLKVKTAAGEYRSSGRLLILR